jgi:hypothetical protein
VRVSFGGISAPTWVELGLGPTWDFLGASLNRPRSKCEPTSNMSASAWTYPTL